MSEPAYKRWYKTARWQKLRARHLVANPLCAMCLPRATKATVCDHVNPHKGDEALFWSGPFQSLCTTCHSSTKQSMERTGKTKPRTGLDGWPEDASASR